MTNGTCCGKLSCILPAVVVSIIVGIITAFLRFMAVITVTPAFLWVLFGIAVVSLFVLPLALSVIRNANVHGCVCSVLTALLTGLVGTILLAIVLLGIAFSATSVIGAVITGALLAFFTLAVTSTACLAKCAARCALSDN